MNERLLTACRKWDVSPDGCCCDLSLAHKLFAAYLNVYPHSEMHLNVWPASKESDRDEKWVLHHSDQFKGTFVEAVIHLCETHEKRAPYFA